ncbi:hypothetical protein ETR_07536 [Erwinia tracheiphila PSU-1]|uniref:hypothetical protein n=1 Tax=Erwinia tracheiphila TaxID=65700 RepID=UPI00033EB856|nr:hypothetical protein [Erwinia tracheiphila]EOS95570.1 hypothetical protein ETR_07536 [Erwinia tracheiphila PSU-1]
MGVLIKLAAVSMKGAEDTDLDTLAAHPLQHGPCGAAEQVVEQGPVVAEKGPQQVGHGKGDRLPCAAGQGCSLYWLRSGDAYSYPCSQRDERKI